MTAIKLAYTHTHTHTYIYIEREREREWMTSFIGGGGPRFKDGNHSKKSIAVEFRR